MSHTLKSNYDVLFDLPRNVFNNYYTQWNTQLFNSSLNNACWFYIRIMFMVDTKLFFFSNAFVDAIFLFLCLIKYNTTDVEWKSVILTE